MGKHQINDMIVDLMSHAGLYTAIALDKINADESYEDLLYSLNAEETIDLYCVECARYTPFSINSYIITDKYGTRLQRKGGDYNLAAVTLEQILIIQLNLICSRNNKHVHQYSLCLDFRNENIYKIGQYPSPSHIMNAEYDAFMSILSKKNQRELNYANQLFAQGIGAGSLIYLKRIYESLIDSAHQAALRDNGWQEDKYKTLSSIDKKVHMLADYLPEFINKNHQMIYAPLHSGIHMLSEEECIHVFPLMRLAIVEICKHKKRNEEDELHRIESERLLKNFMQDLVKVKKANKKVAD